MNKVHQAYLAETGGRNISYAAWLETKLEFTVKGYEELLWLVLQMRDTLRTGSEEERHRLADEVTNGLALSDPVAPAPPNPAPSLIRILK